MAVAQAVLRFAGNERISVDGAVGKQTQSALGRASADIKTQAAAAVRAATGLDINDLIPKIVEQVSDFGTQVVPMLVESAKRAGLLPAGVVAQIVLESGWGASDLSRKWNNYAGLKYNAVSSYPGVKPGSTSMQTQEFIEGKMVSVSQGFATFNDARHFADVYVWYLLEGPSAYRYRNYQGMRGRLIDAATTEEFFKILKNGGYATDPQYVSKAQAIVASVERRYGELLA